jgi:hypothetical protein
MVVSAQVIIIVSVIISIMGMSVDPICGGLSASGAIDDN